MHWKCGLVSTFLFDHNIGAYMLGIPNGGSFKVDVKWWNF